MKGIVFVEFLEMVEEQFSMEMAEEIIKMCHLASEGAYTSLGTYDHQELVQLLVQLSKKTGIALPELLYNFGKYLFGSFVANYSHFLEGANSTFSLLASLNDRIHPEVKKLYPDAELPHFTCKVQKENHMVILYQSSRALSDFAKGLIMGASQHYGEKIEVQKEDISGGKGTEVRFVLTKECKQ